MPGYHLNAQAEIQAIVQTAGRGVKRCLGMMVQRHLRIDEASEPLGSAESLGAGSGISTLYEVTYTYGFWSGAVCVYEMVGAGVTLLAVDATQGTARIGMPLFAPDARSRAWGLSS
jgi:hypothetical protein